jgi:HK97 family phage portal protein
MARWGKRRQVSATATAAVETRSFVGPELGLSDPALADYLGIGGLNDAGVPVTETSSLGSPAAYRSVRLIADTVAAMPMKSYRDADGRRETVASIFDNPGGALLTPYAWKQLVVTYMALHGAAPLLHVYNAAGALDSFLPIHPSEVTVEQVRGVHGRRFKIPALRAEPYTEAELTYVMAFSRDGISGASPISLCRHAIGTALAGDQAAARMFSSGMLIGGLVTPAEDMDPTQATEAITDLKARTSGVRNAGDIVMVNANLKVQPWTMTAEDAQFLESRQYGVEEIARIWGVPKELLSASGATSWGSGIQELVRGFARFTLPAYTTPLEEALSRVLARRSAPGTLVEFEYAGLLRGSPADEIDLLIKQVDAGLLTPDEARAIRNLPPIPGGDVMRPRATSPAGPAQPNETPAAPVEGVPA